MKLSKKLFILLAVIIIIYYFHSNKEGFRTGDFSLWSTLLNFFFISIIIILFINFIGFAFDFVGKMWAADQLKKRYGNQQK